MRVESAGGENVGEKRGRIGVDAESPCLERELEDEMC